jgi:hypothetical protein
VREIGQTKLVDLNTGVDRFRDADHRGHGRSMGIEVVVMANDVRSSKR